MNIQEAVKEANRIDGYITGADKHSTNFIFIKPTNTEDCCIVCVTKNHSRRGWQPRASDLMSNDWKVVSQEEFLILSERNKPFLK